MVEYTCTTCGGLSYSAATNKNTEPCIYCPTGRVIRSDVLVDTVKEHYRVVNIIWKEVTRMQKSWAERQATPEQMLEDVQNLKQELVVNLFNISDGDARTIVNAKVDEFLKVNSAQILDILDDAIYAHINGKI